METWHQLSSDAQFSVAAAVLAALLGGLVSLTASLLVFFLTKREDRKSFERERKARRDVNARVGLAKLVSMINYLYSIDKTISQQFVTATDEGGVILEPALAIAPFISGRQSVDELTASELEFLFFSDSGHLVTEIQIFQSSLATHLEAIREYTRQRQQLDEFSFKHGVHSEVVEGAIATVDFEEREGRQAEVYIGALNRLIAEIIETVARDLKKANELTDEYASLATKVFGEKFPKVEIRSSNQC